MTDAEDGTVRELARRHVEIMALRDAGLTEAEEASWRVGREPHVVVVQAGRRLLMAVLRGDRWSLGKVLDPGAEGTDGLWAQQMVLDVLIKSGIERVPLASDGPDVLILEGLQRFSRLVFPWNGKPLEPR